MAFNEEKTLEALATLQETLEHYYNTIEGDAFNCFLNDKEKALLTTIAGNMQSLAIGFKDVSLSADIPLNSALFNGLKTREVYDPTIMGTGD